MGQKKINNYPIIQAGVMTGTTAIVAPVQNVQNFDRVGFQLTWTGAAVGTVIVQFSNDNVNFVTVAPDNGSITNPNNNAGSYVFGYNNVNYAWCKFTYTNTSSTGVLTVWMMSKDGS